VQGWVQQLVMVTGLATPQAMDWALQLVMGWGCCLVTGSAQLGVMGWGCCLVTGLAQLGVMGWG
jgi:hypothetical protein